MGVNALSMERGTAERLILLSPAPMTLRKDLKDAYVSGFAINTKAIGFRPAISKQPTEPTSLAFLCTAFTGSGDFKSEFEVCGIDAWGHPVKEKVTLDITAGDGTAPTPHTIVQTNACFLRIDYIELLKHKGNGGTDGLYVGSACSSDPNDAGEVFTNPGVRIPVRRGLTASDLVVYELDRNANTIVEEAGWTYDPTYGAITLAVDANPRERTILVRHAPDAYKRVV